MLHKHKSPIFNDIGQVVAPTNGVPWTSSFIPAYLVLSTYHYVQTTFALVLWQFEESPPPWALLQMNSFCCFFQQRTSSVCWGQTLFTQYWGIHFFVKRDSGKFCTWNAPHSCKCSVNWFSVSRGCTSFRKLFEYSYLPGDVHPHYFVKQLHILRFYPWSALLFKLPIYARLQQRHFKFLCFRFCPFGIKLCSPNSDLTITQPANFLLVKLSEFCL